MNTFQQLGVDTDILRSLEQIGYQTPTPIQAKVIPFLLQSSSNLIAKAQTGTGKTAAFGLPIIQNIDTHSNEVQALILSPTRELTRQIHKDLSKFAQYSGDLRISVVYGGANIDQQIKKLKNGSHIVVGTPGRTLDLIKRKKLNISKIKYLVLDEADEMLNMGFKDELEAILAASPQDKQNLLFSATMPKAIRSIAGKYFKNAREISTNSKIQTAENIDHYYVLVRQSQRYQALKRIADFYPGIYGIIFCRTRRETQTIADMLIKDGYSADALHGDLSQTQREYVMKRFRNRQISLLVATDVAARGIDVKDISHIIHYNLPDDNEVYIHRSGRTARAGKKGTSIAILTTVEASKINAIERSAKISFSEMQIPTQEQIFEQKLYSIIEYLREPTKSSELINRLLDVAEQELKDISKRQLLEKILVNELEWLEEYYNKTPEIDRLNHNLHARARNKNYSKKRRGKDKSKAKNKRKRRSYSTA